MHDIQKTATIETSTLYSKRAYILENNQFLFHDNYFLRRIYLKNTCCEQLSLYLKC